MNKYTVNDLDNYLVDVSDAIELAAHENIQLNDFSLYDQVFGFLGTYKNSKLFTILLKMPSAMQNVGNIPNVIIELQLSKLAHKDILKNHELRNSFISFLFNNIKDILSDDNDTGEWKFTNNKAPQSSVAINKRFYVKHTELPSIESIVKSFSLLASIDINDQLDKWYKLNS